MFGGKSSRKNLLALGEHGLPHLNRVLNIRAEVNYVSPEEAKKLTAEDGYTILDIRDKTQYDRAHIKSCYHVPLFIENNDNDFGTIVKRTVHNNFSGLFFGLSFTKPNPAFVSEVQQQISTDRKLLLVCQEGLRSLDGFLHHYVTWDKSMIILIKCHSMYIKENIISGLQSVKPGTFDKEGSKELQDAGKAGLVTIQGKISAVLGTLLVVAYLFLTLFPDQAEKLLQMNTASL